MFRDFDELILYANSVLIPFTSSIITDVSLPLSTPMPNIVLSSGNYFGGILLGYFPGLGNTSSVGFKTG